MLLLEVRVNSYYQTAHRGRSRNWWHTRTLAQYGHAYRAPWAQAGHPAEAADIAVAVHGPDWGAYTVDETALRHHAGVEQETTDAEQAYASFGPREPTRDRAGWLSPR